MFSAFQTSLFFPIDNFWRAFTIYAGNEKVVMHLAGVSRRLVLQVLNTREWDYVTGVLSEVSMVFNVFICFRRDSGSP